MTVSPMTRLLSVMDPAFRYAEHRKAEAFYDAEIFFYQGVEFIAEVERLLEEELRRFLGCPQVETRLVSGQMANMAVYSAILDYINRTNRKVEPRRIRMVMNNHIGKGGHLSAQPMGALKDFVAHDPRTERPAAVNFPVLDHDRFRIDVPLTLELIEQNRPELIIFGKSMVLYREPVAEIRQFLDDRKIDALVMYDMAHVLGLIGPHFQEPFKDGADLVTGSTHKTYFGSQRGVVGGRFEFTEERWELWQALRRRTFPGSVSNHHLGTLLGLLMASYEMNHFKDQYQPQVVANAKAFARALKAAGLDVAGDPEIGYTETHQVIVNVEYAKGPEFATRLEKNNVITNFQAGPEEEGFTASGALRLGVSEMTRFGMDEDCFADLAGLMADAILRDADVKEKVKALRRDHLELGFCFKGEEYEGLMRKLHRLI
jgi:aminomethyltransferase